MFGIFSAANFAFVFFFIKETKGRTLEDMDVLFGTVDAEVRAADIERVLHKGMQDDHHVAKAKNVENVEQDPVVEGKTAAS